MKVAEARARMAAGARDAKDRVDELLGRGPYFTHQPLGRHIEPRGLGGYYCDFSHKAEDLALTRLHELARPFPVIPVAQSALGAWELSLEGAGTHERFLYLCGLLLEDAEPFPGDGIVWHTHVAMPKYALASGWASAMGQGEAISALLRAHLLTGEERYADAARRALVPMTVEVERGGVLRRAGGHAILEEYPAGEPVAVLNGWIFALFGLHELSVATGDERAQELLGESTASLLELLPRYDVGWWSLYSLYDHGRRDLAKPFYQRLHPVLLRGLDMVHPDPRLSELAVRWERQLTLPATARVTIDKVLFRLHWGAGRRRRQHPPPLLDGGRP